MNYNNFLMRSKALTEFDKQATEKKVIVTNTQDKNKVGSRLGLYICDCGIKIRVAKDDLNAKCLDCKTKFNKVEK